jgi:hypothetical protein
MTNALDAAPNMSIGHSCSSTPFAIVTVTCTDESQQQNDHFDLAVSDPFGSSVKRKIIR